MLSLLSSLVYFVRQGRADFLSPLRDFPHKSLALSPLVTRDGMYMYLGPSGFAARLRVCCYEMCPVQRVRRIREK